MKILQLKLATETIDNFQNIYENKVAKYDER